MSSDRRMGAEGSETWTLLLNTAERLMREKGYAAVTSRALGREAKLSPQIVYFYFRTMDDLFEAMFRRLSLSLSASLDRIRQAPDPIVAMWEENADPARSALMVEFLSLSNHRKNLNQQIAEFGRLYTQQQAQIIEECLIERGIDTVQFPPTVLAAILENLACGFVFGEGYNIESHSEAKVFVGQFLQTIFRKP